MNSSKKRYFIIYQIRLKKVASNKQIAPLAKVLLWRKLPFRLFSASYSLHFVILPSELLSDRMLEPALIKVSACIGENRTLLSRILSDLSGIDSGRERENECQDVRVRPRGVQETESCEKIYEREIGCGVKWRCGLVLGLKLNCLLAWHNVNRKITASLNSIAEKHSSRGNCTPSN